MINKLRSAYHHLKHLSHYKHCVLTRTACLGQDIFNLKFQGQKTMANMQKVRADLFIDLCNDKNKPKAHVVAPFMLRNDVTPLINEQETLPWFNKRRSDNLILIDSFSELTDQKFTHVKEGWSFCCNYTDIEHSSEFTSMFECEGLIELSQLEEVYNNFFNIIKKRYHRKDIVFIHFPTALDVRGKFKERGTRILEIMLEHEKRNKQIKNLYVEDGLVLPHANDDFPYHYHIDTQLALLKTW